jgi:hypothetical protein
MQVAISHQFGWVHDLKWCPNPRRNDTSLLGYLAVCFGDGAVRVCAVPYPHSSNAVHCEFILIQIHGAPVFLRLNWTIPRSGE